MWMAIARGILRNRIVILITLCLATVWMGYKAATVQLSYEFFRLLPADDPATREYEVFRKLFGEDGNVLVIGVQDEDIFRLEKFNGWYDLSRELHSIEGVNEVLSIARLYNLSRNDSAHRFVLTPLVPSRPRSQSEVDSLSQTIQNLPFYKGIIYNPHTNATLMAITLDAKIINTQERVDLVLAIKEKVDRFSERYRIAVHYSGLPYIRTLILTLISSEMKKFLMLAAFIAACILLLLFRSIKVVCFSLLIVFVGVVWSVGIIGLLGYRITALTGIIPSLILIIGITNCIYMLNKYHHEYKLHGNKIKALTQMISKIGSATLMTNATTSAGFVSFSIVGAQLLREFGVISSLNVMVVFLLTLLLVPIVFSFLPPPEPRSTRHLDNALLKKFLAGLEHLVIRHRRPVYTCTFLLIAIAGAGIMQMETTGKIAEEFPRDDPVYKDLMFFEKHFGGVIPFEIVVDTRKKRGALQPQTLENIDKMQHVLASYPEFSKPVSVAEIVKFSKQAFYHGHIHRYSLPGTLERNFILPYATKELTDRNLLHSLVDSTYRQTRISVQMADIGTKEMRIIKRELRIKADSIFSPDKYKVMLTGTSVVFLKGTTYLIKNLFVSLLLAVVLISLIMSVLFSSLRMVGISLLPNLIPLMLAAGIMGFAGITIKPSTLLVFSIAFGIAVDNTIHFLSRYSQELRALNGDIRRSVSASLKETGVSMLYTSLVLFFGFGIFSASRFGGTEAMGTLVSITLMLAVLANLIVLPALLLSLEKSIATRAFREPLLQIFDEEEDIEREYLEIRNKENPSQS